MSKYFKLTESNIPVDFTEDQFNLYKWEQAKPDPSKKIKDTKDTILDSVLDEAESLLADGDSVGYFKGIELYSKLLTRFKKVWKRTKLNGLELFTRL